MIRDTYTIAGFTVLVDSELSKTYASLHASLLAHHMDIESRADLRVSIRSFTGSEKMPYQAQLLRRVANVEYFRKERDSILRVPHTAVIVSDFEQGSIEAWICESSEFDSSELLLYAMKWLLIMRAEARGDLYLHGSAVRHAAGYVFFVGDSGTGKSSCLQCLQSRGAQFVSDDVILLSAGFPCYFMPGESPTIQPVSNVQEGFSSSKVTLVFPNVWHAERSKIVEVPSDEIESLLWNIYYREVSWNAYPLDRKTYATRCRVNLTSAKAFKLYAGRSEEAIVQSLSELLEQ